MVIASIHQPSTNTLLLFDNILLLSSGQTVYYGPPANSMRYFRTLGHPPPPMLSPAEFMLELTNTDFDKRDSQSYRLKTLLEAWNASLEYKLLQDNLIMRGIETEPDFHIPKGVGTRNVVVHSLTLCHRMLIVVLCFVIAYPEIIPRSARLRCENSHVPWPCDSYGYRLATSLLLRGQYPKCAELSILRIRFHEFYGMCPFGVYLTSRPSHTFQLSSKIELQ